MPPQPKPASQRRRRNKTTGRRTLSTSPPTPATRRPALGTRRPNWLKATRQWWAIVWASPMADAWIDADVPALRRLALLMELVHRGQWSATLLAEIRQLEDRFGLSPRARRSLEWELGAAEPPQPEEAGVAGEDDGRWLRAVE